MKIVIKTFHGLEEVLAKEIETLGGKNIKLLKRAVSFDGNKEILYRANYELRTALRVLTPIFKFEAKNEDQLYDRIYDHDWSFYFSENDTFAIDADVGSHFFKHSKYVALRSKDAIVDQFRNKSGSRPSVDTNRPTCRIHVRVTGADFVISLDSSGEALFKRGYRVGGHPSPLNEALAAGMVLMSGWNDDRIFMDPMCGSGTLAIEAVMIATKTPPRRLRPYFNFMTWRNFDNELWEKIKNDSENAILAQPKSEIFVSDPIAKYVTITKRNLEKVGFLDSVHTRCKPFQKINPPYPNGLIIMNPPYGERLNQEDVNAFYQMIGDQLKKKFEGYDAWIISSNKEAMKHIGLKPSSRKTLFNGALECKYQHYELYKGSKRLDKKVG